MSGSEDTPPDFEAAIHDAREASERQAGDMLARLKASLPKPRPEAGSLEPLADD